MKSWSEKLFLKINKNAGNRGWLDRFMRFCAHDLIYILAFVAFMWATTVLSGGDNGFKKFVKLLMTAGFFSFAFSWGVALISPHKRPVKEMEDVNQLMKPLGTWKSFPSDHTIGAFTIALVAALMGAPIWFYSILLFMALIIGIGRVYVGVHYPRDIIGGIVVALVFSYSSFWLLENITQPVYDLVKQLFL